MAKDILKAARAEREANRQREQAVEIEVVDRGYRRHVSREDVARIEEERRALRQRLFAAG